MTIAIGREAGFTTTSATLELTRKAGAAMPLAARNQILIRAKVLGLRVHVRDYGHLFSAAASRSHGKGPRLGRTPFEAADRLLSGFEVTPIAV